MQLILAQFSLFQAAVATLKPVNKKCPNCIAKLRLSAANKGTALFAGNNLNATTRAHARARTHLHGDVSARISASGELCVTGSMASIKGESRDK